MKILFVLLSVLSINTCLSQTKVKSVNVETSDTVKVSTQNYPITISIKKGEEQVVHDQNFYQSEIKRIDDHIKAIDDKIQWTIQNGIVDSEWLMDMERIKSELRKEKSEILQKLN